MYRKLTHADQYLNFSSHHPIEYKLSVARTLLEEASLWLQTIMTDNWRMLTYKMLCDPVDTEIGLSGKLEIRC